MGEDTLAKQGPAEATSCLQHGPSRLSSAQEFHLILSPRHISLQDQQQLPVSHSLLESWASGEFPAPERCWGRCSSQRSRASLALWGLTGAIPAPAGIDTASAALMYVHRSI